jgi:hypothetical protein
MKKIIFIILSLAVVAGIVFLLTSRGDSMTPEERIASAFYNTTELETFSSLTSLEMEGSVESSSFTPQVTQGSISMSVDSLVDIANENMSGDINFSAGADGVTISGEASFILSDNKFFGRLNSPLPGVTPGYINKWFLLMSEEDIDIDLESLSPEKVGVIYENMIEEGVLAIKYDGRDKINGIDTRKYRIDIDTDNLLRAVQKSFQEMDIDEDVKNSVIEEIDYMEEYDPFTDIDVVIYIWVNKHVHQIETHFSGSIDDINIERGLIKANYGDFNKPVSISAPEDYEDPYTYHDDSFSDDIDWDIQPETRIMGRDNRIISAMTQIRTQAEIYSINNNNSYIGMENDENIQALLLDIADLSEVFFPDVEVSEKEYCVSTPLVSGSSFCIDSMGTAREAICYPYSCQ